MVFAETVLPSGKILFKGLGKLSCQMVLKDTRLFYLTDALQHARDYGRTCSYRVKKNLRLFDLTHKNVAKLLESKYPLKQETRDLLRLVLGTGLKIGHQVQIIRALFGYKNVKSVPGSKFGEPGERISYTELNKRVFGNLSREFLGPEGYDGYYAPKKKSIFHGGEFHSEIMLTNAYQKIERVTRDGPAPVVTNRSLAWALPRLFMDFSKNTTRLVRPYGGGLVIFCTGGMGVRLYLEARKRPLPLKIRRTSDFDFTFGLPRKLRSDAQVATYVNVMRRIMTQHLTAFVKWLNKNYIGANARLRVSTFGRTRFDHPRIQVPGTKRMVYQVISYKIVTGQNEETDLVDTALAVYPGASRHMLHMPFSMRTGIPIQRLRYQLRDSMALLSGSFVHKGMIAKRNPITGIVKEKGQKNAERTARLLNIVRKRKKYYTNLKPLLNTGLPLLAAVHERNVHKARVRARNVNRALKKIK